MKRLNLGCGRDIRSGYINLDIVKGPGIDVVHDLEKFPYPFKDGEFDEIIAFQVMEHLRDYRKVLSELDRILKREGKIIIEVPHFSSMTAYDPDHRLFFNARTFLEKYGKLQVSSLQSAHDSGYSCRVRIQFFRGLQFWNYAIERIVNRSVRMQVFYEISCFSRLFPAWKIRFEAVKH